MNKLLTLAGIVAIVASVTVGVATSYAQTTSETDPVESPDTTVTNTTTEEEPSKRPANASERVAEARASREAFAAAKCEKITANLTKRKEQITNAAERHLEIYGRVETRVAKIIAFAETKSYDTTELTAASTLLSADIDAFEVTVTELKTLIDTVDPTTCGKGDSVFSDTVIETRDALAATREASKKVRTTIREEVIPASVAFVTSLKGQNELKGNSSETETETEPAKTEEEQ